MSSNPAARDFLLRKMIRTYTVAPIIAACVRTITIRRESTSEENAVLIVLVLVRSKTEMMWDDDRYTWKTINATPLVLRGGTSPIIVIPENLPGTDRVVG